MDFDLAEENALLEDPNKGYGGQELKFKRSSRGNDEDQDLTESEYLVKSLQEVQSWTN